MLSKAKKKMYTAYLGVLPVGYYFNGTYACPPNEHKATESNSETSTDEKSE